MLETGRRAVQHNGSLRARGKGKAQVSADGQLPLQGRGMLVPYRVAALQKYNARQARWHHRSKYLPLHRRAFCAGAVFVTRTHKGEGNHEIHPAERAMAALMRSQDRP